MTLPRAHARLMGMAPILVPPGGGEPIAASPGKRISIVADLPELVAVMNEYAPGARGPDPHVHREHHDCFWVLEGELAFEVAGEPMTFGAGDWLAVPPGLSHAFSSPDGARFLNLHAPGSHFAGLLRGELMAENVDQWPVPDGGGRPASDAIVLRAGDEDERTRHLGGSSLRFALEHAGPLALTVLGLAPGFPGPVPHRHREMTDSFLVVAGRPSFLVGDERVEAEPGTWVSVPPGNRHTFSGHPEEPAELLNFMAPGGLEQYLKEVVALSAGGPADPAKMAEIASAYDFVPVP